MILKINTFSSKIKVIQYLQFEANQQSSCFLLSYCPVIFSSPFSLSILLLSSLSLLFPLLSFLPLLLSSPCSPPVLIILEWLQRIESPRAMTALRRNPSSIFLRVKKMVGCMVRKDPEPGWFLSPWPLRGGRI